MRKEEQCVFAGGSPTAGEVTKGPGDGPQHQRALGIAGRLRPYRDVRAGFETWRLLALQEWVAREEAITVS